MESEKEIAAPGRPMARRSISVVETEWAEPVAVFAAIEKRQGVVWLDSGMNIKGLGRWSYLLCEPFATLRGAGRDYTFMQRGRPSSVHGDPFEIVKNRMGGWDAGDDPSYPPFTGGAAGFFGYDLLAHCEPSTRLVKSARAREGDLWLGFYDGVIAFDHESGKAYLVANVEQGQDAAPVIAALRETMDRAAGRGGGPQAAATGSAATVEPKSGVTRSDYLDAVERVRAYIEAGDCYQVNIAQQYTFPDGLEPAALYLRLRDINPAPFAAYIDTGACQILSSSPERFLSVRDGKAQTRPIKGTRPRGGSAKEDERLARELLQSGKDRAENVMIVDLLRNDLSRVCRPHSVTVTELCALEAFPTVYHLVSTVEGELRNGCGAVDALKTAFPGGSVTGAPKIRAMEIIDEIEPVPRGVYCGAIGVLGFNGVMDTSVVIRTIVRAGGEFKFHTGGGVTWLSDPVAEYEETLDKARALIRAVRT